MTGFFTEDEKAKAVGHARLFRMESVFCFLAVALIFGAVVMTPAFLLELKGPMMQSLGSQDERVRDTAVWTVHGFRGLMLVAAMSFLAVAAFWKTRLRSRFNRRISRCRLLVHPRDDDRVRFLNDSLIIMLIVTAILFLYVAFGDRFISETVRHWINREDGFIQSVQALLFLLCGVANTVLFLKFRAVRFAAGFGGSLDRRAVWHGLLGIFFFFCVGEEISWGQRLFGWETFSLFQIANVQDETNFHNLFGYVSDHLFVLGVLTYGAIIPLLSAGYSFWKRLFNWAGLPVASAGLGLAFLFVSCLHDWSVYRVLPTGSGLKIAEMRELLTASGFLLLAWESRRLWKHNVASLKTENGNSDHQHNETRG